MMPTSVRIFVCTERQDMRRSFDALALAVKEKLDLDEDKSSKRRRQRGSVREPVRIRSLMLTST